MADQIVPLTTEKVQKINASLNVDGSVLRLNLTVTYNAMAQYWVMDVADETDSPLVCSIPMVTGEFPASNLLEQFAYLGIGSARVENTGADGRDYPGENDLGTTFTLIWGDSPGSSSS